MATSSIFASFNINDKKTANAFVRALDKSVQNSKHKSTKFQNALISDYKAIRALVSKGKKK